MENHASVQAANEIPAAVALDDAPYDESRLDELRGEAARHEQRRYYDAALQVRRELLAACERELGAADPTTNFDRMELKLLTSAMVLPAEDDALPRWRLRHAEYREREDANSPQALGDCLAWLAETRDWQQASVTAHARVLCAIAQIEQSRNRLAEAQQRLEQAISLIGASGIAPTDVLHRAQTNLMQVYAEIGRDDEAAALAQSIVEAAPPVRPASLQHSASILFECGNSLRKVERFDDALAVYERLLAELRAIDGDTRQFQALTLVGIAQVHRARNDEQAELKCHSEAIQLQREAGVSATRLFAATLLKFAEACRQAGHCAEARQTLVEVLELVQQQSFSDLESHAVHVLARLETDCDRQETALLAWLAALAKELPGENAGVGYCIAASEYAALQRRRGALAEAETIISMAIPALESRDDLWAAGRARLLIERGRLAMCRNDLDESRRLLAEAAKLASDEWQDEDEIHLTWLLARAELDLASGELESAEQGCAKTLALRRQRDGARHPGTIPTLEVLEQILTRVGKTAEAQAAAQEKAMLRDAARGGDSDAATQQITRLLAAATASASAFPEKANPTRTKPNPSPANRREHDLLFNLE